MTSHALLLIAVLLLSLCVGCHHTSVQCHGPVTVEATVDAQAGLTGACRDCCECAIGAAGKAACELRVQ